MKALYGLLVLTFTPGAFGAEVTPADKVESFVNIRSGPAADTDVVGQLRKGESLHLKKTVDGWHAVEFADGVVGYVHADWARVVADIPVADVSAVTSGDAEDPETALATDAESVNDETLSDSGPASVPERESTVDVGDSASPGSASQVADTESSIDTVADIVEEAPEAIIEPTPVSETARGYSLLKGDKDFVVRFKTETTGTSSQIYDDGNVVGIGTTAPQQRLEVNGSIQIFDQNSGVAGLMITQSSGETGYILHNRASTLTIGAGSVDRLTIDRNGNIGVAVARPAHPLEMASGAHVTAGGVWTNSSSRRRKHQIVPLDAKAATAALQQLEPVSFRYRDETGETYLGFIAEDVPDIVATGDRDSLSPMDLVALLTRVVQDQERRIADLEKALVTRSDRR